LPPKKSNQKKVPAAPASLMAVLLVGLVLSEPDDAGFGRLTLACAFWMLTVSLIFLII